MAVCGYNPTVEATNGRLAARPCELVVVGGSAGGIRAAAQLLAALPAEFPASMLLVLHRSPTHDTPLWRVLDARGPLTVRRAVDGATITPGRVLIAPPDRHLLVQDGHVHLDDGPRVNGFRPAVDPLFWSAAEVFGPRVVGVVLSGWMADATAGLRAIKEHGGLALVQDPVEAPAWGMPRNAIANVAVDGVLPVGAMAGVLRRLTASSVGAPVWVNDHGARNAGGHSHSHSTGDYSAPQEHTGWTTDPT